MQNNKSINLYDDPSSEEFDLSLNYSDKEDNIDINNIKNINNDDETNNLIISNLNNKQTEQLSKDIQLSILVSTLLDIVFENKKGNLNKILSLLQKYDILNNDFVDYNYSESKFKIKHLINSLLNDNNNLKTLTNKIVEKSDKNNIIIYNKKKKNENLDNNYNNNFIELDNIGNGSYGSVYKVYHKYEKNLYAIKKVHITNELIKDNTDIFREIQLFSKLNHKNIVRYYSSWLDDYDNNSTLYIQMELCESTFRDYLNNIREDESIEKRIFYFNQIVEGIKYLHDNNIIHRDIKPSNILFIDDTVKICDFGLARNVNSTINIMNGSSEVGTSFYRAPEIDTHNYNNKIDVYSLGIILIELLLKHCKTQAEKMMCMKEILENIKENKIESIPYLITNRYDVIIMNMINVNVEERYDIYQINILIHNQ
jgi:hypothetical protein